ncbi:hypothetical protein [Paenibacillus harenae]|uniref:hypothetical protein n=1 Tax=Paenibacillus harenae TaxID=306543 RepID=UPI002793E673|nr:hypothetical protein [Paenibacillus harenae]MDQ0059547.1 hypothetical protein [Paenibacillus harenae]
MAVQREPKRWLSLSYSGLAAMDQYTFTGSMNMSLNGGTSFSPRTFEGKVIDHKQLTLQTNSGDQLHINPVLVLESLAQSDKNNIVISESSDPDTITLQIAEDDEASKKRWEQRLRQQLEALMVNEPPVSAPYKKEWDQEAERSRKQLEAMLSSMRTKSSYELVIDRNRLLPLRLDEQTVFQYEYGGKTASEARHTAIRFQAFEGSSSAAVQ